MASIKIIKNDAIKNAKRIVIKIGSSLIIDSKDGNLNYAWMRTLAENSNFFSPKFYRIINEIPTVLLIGIILVVVFKPLWDL